MSRCCVIADSADEQMFGVIADSADEDYTHSKQQQFCWISVNPLLPSQKNTDLPIFSINTYHHPESFILVAL